ncbi:MAG TPA: hypothetical protein VEP67_09165 [Thiobacillaceae bacterium]|nr:hypothetical protein [Thiobacillaceae bacterium]
MHEDHLNLAITERLAIARVGGSTPARRAGAVLRHGLLLLLFSAGAAEADAGQIVCPALLLEQECRVYQADLSSAPSADARDALKARYEGLLFERERACFCNPQRSWIRLTETATVPHDNLQHKVRIIQDKSSVRL